MGMMAETADTPEALREAARRIQNLAPGWAARTRQEAGRVEREEGRRRIDAEYEVLGKDTVATCMMHRRRVRWEPAPAWWVHDDGLPHFRGVVYQDGRSYDLGDPRTCAGMWPAQAPIITVRRATGETVYPDERESRRRAAQFEYRTGVT